jgi:hypothetical protein
LKCRGSLVCFRFFSGVVEGVFAGGFAIFGCAERGFSMVKRGGFVVKVRLETAPNRALKNMPTF